MSELAIHDIARGPRANLRIANVTIAQSAGLRILSLANRTFGCSISSLSDISGRERGWRAIVGGFQIKIELKLEKAANDN